MSELTSDQIFKQLISSKYHTTALLYRELLSRDYRVGFPFWPLTYMRFTSPRGEERLLDGIVSDRSSALAARICKNKYHTCMFVRDLGLVVEPFYLCDTTEAAERAWDEFKGDCVMKKVDIDAGKGIVTRFSSRNEFLRIFGVAQDHAGVMVQRRSDCSIDLRVTIVGGVYVAATTRRPVELVGDGKSTLLDLIHEQNLERKKHNQACAPMRRVFLLDKSIVTARTGLSLEYVLGFGQKVQATLGNVSEGANTADVTDYVHDGYVAYAKTIARNLNEPIVAVDFLVNDPMQYDIGQSGGASFLEVNLRPGITFQQFPENGRGPDIAKAFIDCIIG